MSQPVYVFALMGTAPAVVTELCWHLVTVQRKQIVGLEIWTTGPDDDPGLSGAKSLRLALDNGAWESLRGTLSAAARAALPHMPSFDALREAPPPSREELAHASAGDLGTRFALFTDAGGTPLRDVRDPLDADLVQATLHDRVRELRLGLPSKVDLVASLAGGRKTMSAALSTAFELQARPQDRLVHVLVHEELEPLVAQGGPPWWWCPHPITDEEVERVGRRAVAVRELGMIDDPVMVFDQPRVQIRELLRGDLRNPIDVLDHRPFIEVMDVLSPGGLAMTHAVLRRRGSPWAEAPNWTLEGFTSLDGNTPAYTLELTDAAATLVQALARSPHPIHTEGIREAFLNVRALAGRRETTETAPTEGTIRSYLSKTRDLEGSLEGYALRMFLPKVHGRTGRRARYYVPRASSLQVVMDGGAGSPP